MSEYFAFDCGCKFDIIDNSGDIPLIKFDPELININLECSRTWELISSGNTKGCFQLESRLGQMMAKKLKPSNIQELSGLISILRPGCLEAYRDGKSVSNHYIDKKNGLESIDYFHPALEPILKDTYSEMIYQEQAMSISKELAGFDLQEADELRKAIGKKQADKMSKLKSKFIDGCAVKGSISKMEAEQIFGWIEKSQRYLFNASHSISYAMNAYLSAYAKAHFPKIFFASYLRFAKDKVDPQQEIKELVRNATEMDIRVSIPDLRNLNQFFILKNKIIYFGLTDIKGLGVSVFQKILKLTGGIDINNMEWIDILIDILLNINSIASKALISSGALDYLKKNRTEMLYEYDLISELTKKEIEKCQIIKSETKNLSLLKLLQLSADVPKTQTKRKTIMQNMVNSLMKPPYSLIDKIEWLSDSENNLLGASITCFKIDTYDTGMTNCNCKTFKTSSITNNIILAGEISNINVTKTKNGKNPGQEMAFISIEDQYGMLDSVILFPEQLSKYRTHLFNGNILIFSGNRSKTKDGLVVEKCYMPVS
jgi:DNA polymerase III alpha subunit